MKTIIYTLGIFALFVSPASCSKEKLNFSNDTYITADNTMASKEDDTPPIDPPKPAPKPE